MTFLFLLTCFSGIVSSEIFERHNQSMMDRITNYTKNCRFAIEVWVDDDYFEGGYNGGHTWGYDAFDNIKDGIFNVSDGGIVHIHEGTYDPFIIVGRSDILVEAITGEIPIVTGCQQVWDSTSSSMINSVIFINSSINIHLKGLNIQGNNLNGRSYAVFYNQATGVIDTCTISPNQKGNMANLAIRAQINSSLSVENCTIKNYGRIGIYIRTGTILHAVYNQIIGQIYTDDDGDYVSYGIEVEDLLYTSHATIRYNEIVNHDHIGNPTWSSAAIIVDAWRYYQSTSENCSATIEYNSLHDNMIGVQIIPNENIHVNYNEIYNHSSHGAVSDPYWNGTAYIYYYLDAKQNWWGDKSGPYHPTENPDGQGDEITDFIYYTPWITFNKPIINLTSPENGFLYINIKDIFNLKIPFFTNLIIGKIEVEADAPRCLYGINRVEFFKDDELQATDYTEPYSWDWDDTELFLLYTITVVAYDNNGNSASDEIAVWKFL
jgi:hypothetical protein